MDIVVLCGGLSPERNVSLSSGTKIASALMELGHRVVLCDMFFGLEDYAGELDGLLFSDIQSHKGQVVVYGAGPAFRELRWGAEHAYEGTIAQDIERFGLRSLTVEDTLDLSLIHI